MTDEQNKTERRNHAIATIKDLGTKSSSEILTELGIYSWNLPKLLSVCAYGSRFHHP